MRSSLLLLVLFVTMTAAAKIAFSKVAPQPSYLVAAAAPADDGNLISDLVDKVKDLPQWVWVAAAAAFWYKNKDD